MVLKVEIDMFSLFLFLNWLIIWKQMICHF